VPNKKPKHAKAKSQENIKISANDWSQLLVQHDKTQKKESVQVVSKYAFCNRKGVTADAT